MATRKKTKKMEFSKQILLVAGIINIVTIALTFILVWITFDLSPLCWLIPSVAAEVATGTAFYYSKAKVENRIKLMKANKIPLDETSFREF